MKKIALLLTFTISIFIHSQEDNTHVVVTTDTYTFLESDLAACKPHIFIKTNVTATLPETSLNSFAFLPIKLLNNNSVITIIPGAGVKQLQFVYDNSNLENGGDAISLYSYINDEWGVWKGSDNVIVSIYTPATITNYYNVSNALADNTYEANSATTGIVANRTTVSVETTNVSNGNYALKVQKTVSGGAKIEVDMRLDNTTDYTMTLLVKSDGSALFTPNAWSGITNFEVLSGTTTTEYSTYTIRFTTTSNSQTAKFYNYGALNSVWYLDQLIVNKTSDL
ncbi:hypothetical protein [Winogradskyella sp. PG-2]|uniref:hypothetical protein n=1 Tax=Winogradskyella sp. PG-2 TaxID=754409 RepID=UPI0004588227|nr:hypothetical protein [Winogradskyella sp. PG-2]BAO75539.1 hypothetical protein WPG_1309 [Winogradskyella sp. PG-2]